MILEEDPDTSATIVSADYVLDGGSPDVVDTTPPNVGGSDTLDLVGTIDLSNGAVVCDRP